MVNFENFVKSMTPTLLELKVTPSFCFTFKIPDDRTATSIKYLPSKVAVLIFGKRKRVWKLNFDGFLSFGQKFFTACHKCGHFTGYVVTLVILTKVLFWMPAIGASPTNWRSCPRHSSWVNLGVVDFFFSLTPFCFRFSNRSKTLARFLSACRWLWKIDVDAGTHYN